MTTRVPDFSVFGAPKKRTALVCFVCNGTRGSLYTGFGENIIRAPLEDTWIACRSCVTFMHRACIRACNDYSCPKCDESMKEVYHLGFTFVPPDSVKSSNVEKEEDVTKSTENQPIKDNAEAKILESMDPKYRDVYKKLATAFIKMRVRATELPELPATPDFVDKQAGMALLKDLLVDSQTRTATIEDRLRIGDVSRRLMDIGVGDQEQLAMIKDCPDITNINSCKYHRRVSLALRLYPVLGKLLVHGLITTSISHFPIIVKYPGPWTQAEPAVGDKRKATSAA